MNEVKGTVTWFNQDKGYGFIAGDDKVEYFVHYRGLPDGIKSLYKNQRVSFVKIDGKKGPVADNVKVS